MVHSPPDPDRDFQQFAASGDPEALARVFDATAPKLLLLARHVARDGADAEDLVQSTFVAAMRNPHSYEPRRPVLAWLCGILANRAADARRRRARRRAEDLDAENTEPLDAESRAPLEVLLDREAAEEVARALDRLPPAERDVCVLKLVHGLSGVEAAHALGRPPATVRTQLRRGLQRLRRLLPRSLAAPAAFALPDATTLARLRTAVLAELPEPGAAATASVAAGGLSALLTSLAMKKTLLSAAGAAVVITTAWFAWPETERAPAADDVAASRGVPRTATAQREEPATDTMTPTVEETPRNRTALEDTGPTPVVITGRVVRIGADRLPEPPAGTPPRRRPVQPLDTDDAPAWPGLAVGWAPPDRGTWSFVPVTRTDAGGRFRVVCEQPEARRRLVIATVDENADAAPGQPRPFDLPSVYVVPKGDTWTTEDLGDLPLREHLANLTVEVVDPDGEGIADAFVHLATPHAGHPRLGTMAGGTSRPTDAAGRIRWPGLAPIGSYRLQVSQTPNGLVFPDGGKLYTATVRFTPDRPTHRVTMRRSAVATTVRGVVLDAQRRPLEDVRLSALVDGRTHQVVETGADGHFEFSGPAGGELTHLAVPPHAMGDRRFINPELEPWQATGPISMGTPDLEIVLRRRGVLTLQVVDAAGEPVEDFRVVDVALRPERDQPAALVWYELGGRPDSSDPRRRGFAGHHPEGRLDLPSLRGDHWLLVVPDDRARHAPAGYLRYTMPDSGVLPLRVALPDAVARRVHVVDQAGAAVAGSSVELIVHYADGPVADDDLRTTVPLGGRLQASHFGRPRQVATRKTGDDGSVILHWRNDPGDRLTLRVRGDAHPTVHRHDLRWAGPDPLRVTVLRGPELRGRVVPADAIERIATTYSYTGSAARRASSSVELRLESTTLDAAGAPLRIGTRDDPLRVEPDGSFRIPSVPAGTWRVYARVNDRGSAGEPITTWHLDAERDPVPIELDLSSLLPARLRGRIHHDRPGARVIELSLRHHGYHSSAPLDGPDFDIAGVPPGDTRLSVRLELPDGSRVLLPAPEPVRIRPGADPQLHDIHLQGR